MSLSDSHPVKKTYPRKAAGHRMTERVPVVTKNATALQVFELIRADLHRFDEIHFIYVTDEAGHLLGFLSLKDLFRLPSDSEVGSALHKRELHAVHPDSHQEHAANLALRHNLKVVPIVDKDKRFLGTLTEDAILSILHKELREDILRLSGIHPGKNGLDNILEMPLLTAVVHRLPWLLLGLAGGLITAQYVGFFERTLEKNLILAAFIPLIVYMSDAVGTQMEAFVIRDFALVQSLDFFRYFIKQLAIVLALALILGGILVGVGFFLYRDWPLLVILGPSLVLAILSSVFTGLIVPFLFRKARMDPANASGPVATVVQDFLSVVIYFAMASWVLPL